MFPIFLDWMFIKPITINFFNNKKLKKNIRNLLEKNTETYIGTIFLNQYVGHTLSDIFTFYNKCPLTICNIFELMYGLFVIHTKCNIAHGDISLVNITFKENNISSNTVNVYVLSDYGEIDTYVFHNNNISCYLIDFSKSFVNEDFFDDTIKDRKEMFLIKQELRINAILKKYIDIQVTLLNFNRIFSILCIIDYIELGECLKIIFKDTELSKLIDLLINESYKYIQLTDYKNIELKLFKSLFNDYGFKNNHLELIINDINCITN